MSSTAVISTTAVSGDTLCAYRSTSMPLVCGMRISLTTTSNSAASIFFFALSPDATVSTLCPSLRRAISSISQIERSSSTTSTLPTSPPSRRDRRHGFILRRHGGILQRDGKLRPFSVRGRHLHLALVRLHHLVHDRQSQASATRETRLERLKHFFHLVPAHSA